MRELVHPLRTGQVPQANSAEIDQDDFFRKVMNGQFPNSTRQQYLAGVTDLSKVTATACDQALGVSIARRRFTGMKCETKGPSTLSGSHSGDRSLDVESERERIRCTVETCQEAFVFALQGSRPSMTTEDSLEEGVQSLENSGSVRIERSWWSGRLGGQHNCDSCGGAHGQINPGDTAGGERGKAGPGERRRASSHSKTLIGAVRTVSDASPSAASSV